MALDHPPSPSILRQREPPTPPSPFASIRPSTTDPGCRSSSSVSLSHPRPAQPRPEPPRPHLRSPSLSPPPPSLLPSRRPSPISHRAAAAMRRLSPLAGTAAARPRPGVQRSPPVFIQRFFSFFVFFFAAMLFLLYCASSFVYFFLSFGPSS